jgi:hypothetical protein
MREHFTTINFRSEARAVIEQANAIIEQHQAQGFVLTLRQLYYQFVSRGLIANEQAEYKRLGTIVADARRAGLIDWGAIEDRTRYLRDLPTWRSPADRIADAAELYREDIWATQPYRVEVWIEKDALVGVIEDVCNAFRVPYFSCRGNVSDSEMYAAGKRFAAWMGEIEDTDQWPIILHLGDHDPAGLDMTRDIERRLGLFSRSLCSVQRLALNLDQTAGLPPNPAKDTDSRYAEYVKRYGTTDSWELDALDPVIIVNLIRNALMGYIDAQAWNAAMTEEEASRAVLVKAAQNWAAVERVLTQESDADDA